MPDRAARRVLDAWTDRLHPAETALALARWEAAVAATAERRERVEAAAKALEARAHDEAGFARVEQSLAERIDDPVLRRALERLRLRLAAHRVPRPERLVELEAEVASEFAIDRAEMDGERLDGNAVRHRLRTSDDGAEVERVWRAAAAIGSRMADRVREMTRLRNEHAVACGYADFRAMRLSMEEVVPASLARFLDDLERASTGPWTARKARIDRVRAERFGTRPDALAPWHYGDLFLHAEPEGEPGPDPFADRDPVDLAKKTFAGIGLDVDAVLERSDLAPRDAKNPHAFCTHIDREGDVRVLANVVPSRRWTRTLLHELGHAVYELGLDPETPWVLRRPPHAASTEGVAMLFGRLVEDATWREKVAKIPPDPEAPRQRRANLLAFLRWALVIVRFEEGLYADPDRDLDELWWGTVERIQGLRRPAAAPPGVWAAKIHVACWPVYYHAYLLGETVASALDRHIRRDVFGRELVANPPAGAYLKERVFRPGATLHWERHLEEATHAPLDAATLLRDALPEELVR